MNVPEQTSLVIGCCEPSSHRAKAVLDGTLSIPNCSSRFVKLGAGEMLHRSFTDAELNVAELSLSSYVSHIALGECPYVILPVYIARLFPHSAFYARTDRGISGPQDLRGKRVGSGAFQRTLNVWARGFLEDEYAISARDVQWVIRDSLDASQAFKPQDARIEFSRTDATLSQMLEAGELDAVIAAHPPECYTRGVPAVKRLFQNEQEAAQEYFRRTAVCPILHVMGVRRTLLHSRPELARELFVAFSKAQELAFSAAEIGAATSWHNQAHSYGVGESDRKSLATFLRYHYSQGLSKRQLDVDDLLRR